MRKLQFNHERHYSKSGLLPKGGCTVALEVPTTEEFDAFYDMQRVKITVGVAVCSLKDHYNKKTGRDLAISRLTEITAVVGKDSHDNVHLLTENFTIILKKMPMGSIRFIEVV